MFSSSSPPRRQRQRKNSNDYNNNNNNGEFFDQNPKNIFIKELYEEVENSNRTRKSKPLHLLKRKKKNQSKTNGQHQHHHHHHHHRDAFSLHDDRTPLIPSYASLHMMNEEDEIRIARKEQQERQRKKQKQKQQSYGTDTSVGASYDSTSNKNDQEEWQKAVENYNHEYHQQQQQSLRQTLSFWERSLSTLKPRSSRTERSDVHNNNKDDHDSNRDYFDEETCYYYCGYQVCSWTQFSQILACIILLVFTIVIVIGPKIIQTQIDIHHWCPLHFERQHQHQQNTTTTNTATATNKVRNLEYAPHFFVDDDFDDDIIKNNKNIIDSYEKDDDATIEYENPDYSTNPCLYMRTPYLFYLTIEEADLCTRMLVSVLFGGFIGYERRSADRPAGIRTMGLVALGSCFFTISSQLAFKSSTMGWDASRVTAAIPSGVGFLGAGLIWKGSVGEGIDAVHQVHGLTTAASLWLAASIGVGCGGKLYFVSAYSMILVTMILRYGPKVFLDYNYDIDNQYSSNKQSYEDDDDDDASGNDSNDHVDGIGSQFSDNEIGIDDDDDGKKIIHDSDGDGEGRKKCIPLSQIVIDDNELTLFRAWKLEQKIKQRQDACEEDDISFSESSRNNNDSDGGD
mmetsp:Transcript_33149/g.38601  ORF Transcript_33149/g.38601 Transcript_33149/m.38601 type:complete len:625 (+) Transcript_33149:148-2022(+)